MRALVTDPTRSALLIVTLPEELPARETALLARDATAQVGIPLGPLVVNGVPSAAFENPTLLQVLATPIDTSAPTPLRQTLSGLRVLGERRHDAAAVLARLTREPGLPLVQLPRLPETDLGPLELAVLTAELTAGLAR
jgi:hypothetical protein